MRCLCFWPLLLLTTTFVCAQPTGTEWIRAGQPYYKIPVAKGATYALTPDYFRRVGVDPSTLDPRTFQLFHRGREQAVRVSGKVDGRFDPGDSLLFRGQANDGLADSALYRPASAQPHPFYNLFSDTTYYFLTWRPGVLGLRAPVNQTTSAPISRTIVQVFTTDYPAGAIYPLGASTTNGSVLSHYDEGEGWTGPVVSTGQSFSVVVPLTGAVWSDSSQVRVQMCVAGRNAWPHRVAWWVNGRRMGESVFENYATGRFSVLLNGLELGKPDALTVVVQPQNVGEQVSLSAVRVVYDGLAERAIPLTAPDLQPVRFRVLEGRRSNYLIVTHPLLRQRIGAVADPVGAYAAYRASLAGGSYDTLTVNIGELFDLFTYGERSPLAIRRFAHYMLRQNGSRYTQAPHLFLVGQSRDPQGVRKNPNAALLDLVPNGGWPGSDALLVEGLNGVARDVPALAVGRLNTSRPQTVLDYLSKVREYENTLRSPQLWRKTLLHLSGGRSADELSRFRGFVQEFAQVAERPPLGAKVTIRGKQTDEPVEAVPVADLVNKGVGLITVFGHSGLDLTDVDLGFATDDRRGYQNRGRYPFLLVNGCAAGNVFFGRPTVGTDWVTAPDRGAIGFLAHTYNGFPNEMRAFTNAFYETLNDPRWQTETVGRVHGETVRRYLSQNQTLVDTANAQQFLLQGDPAIRLFPFDKPDYAFGDENSLTNQNDSLLARMVLTNSGRAEPGSLPVRIRQYTTEGQLLSEQTRTLPRPLFADTLRLSLSTQNRSASGQVIELKLNPAEQLPEYDFSNNTLILGGTSSTELPFPPDNVPPLLEVAFDGQRIENEAVVAPRPLISLRIRDDNPRLLRRDTTGLLLYLLRPAQAKTGQFERLNWRNATLIPEADGRSFRVDYRPDNPWPDGHYKLEAYASDLSGNRAAPYRIAFRVMGQPGVLAAGVGPNPFGGYGGNVPTRFYLTLTGSEPPESVQLTIKNLNGQVIWQATQPGRIGWHDWFWNGTGNDNYTLPAGVYLYQFRLVGLGASAFNVSERANLTGRVLLIR